MLKENTGEETPLSEINLLTEISNADNLNTEVYTSMLLMTLEHYTAIRDGRVGNAALHKVTGYGQSPPSHLHYQFMARDIFTNPARQAAKAFCCPHPPHPQKEPSSQNTSGRLSVLKTEIISISQKSRSKSEARIKTVQMSLCIAAAQSQIYTATKLRIERGTPIDISASYAQRLPLVNSLQKLMGNPHCYCISKRHRRAGCNCIT